MRSKSKFVNLVEECRVKLQESYEEEFGGNAKVITVFSKANTKMSNEEYWMIHEMGETVLGSDEHLCRNMRYEKDKVLKYQLAVSRNLIARVYISLMEILDKKQKRGRLIVGEQRNE